MLEVRDIHTYYGDSHVLQGVSLSMSRGQVVGILGRNGMGKTTLIRSIIGFTSPRRGRVVFKYRDITAWPSNRAVALGLGLVPQGRRVFPSLTVMENLEVAVKADRGPWTVPRVLELFPRLRERGAHRDHRCRAPGVGGGLASPRRRLRRERLGQPPRSAERAPAAGLEVCREPEGRRDWRRGRLHDPALARDGRGCDPRPGRAAGEP